MTKLTKFIAVVALALWGLGTMHCDLEQVPGFGFLAWCHLQEDGSQPSQDCGGDNCSEVESTLYKAEQHVVTIPLPVLAVSFLLPRWDLPSMAGPAEPVRLNQSPPELPRQWQFVHRTALAPRAPSLIA